MLNARRFQVVSHIGVQLTWRRQQHGMAAASGKRPRDQRVGEHLPAGHDGRAAQAPHVSRRVLRSGRATYAVAVGTGHPLGDDACEIERVNHGRFDAAARSMSTTTCVWSHHHCPRDADPLQELARVITQLAWWGHQHGCGERPRKWGRYDGVGPPLARHQASVHRSPDTSTTHSSESPTSAANALAISNDVA